MSRQRRGCRHYGCPAGKFKKWGWIFNTCEKCGGRYGFGCGCTCGNGRGVVDDRGACNTCSDVGVVDATGTCSNCTDPAMGVGPQCAFTNAATCSDVGVVDAAGTCSNCADPATGVGPRCAYTNAATCNGKGVVDATGACDCTSPVTGTGPTCSEYTNARTCNGKGVVDATGACECTSPVTGTGPTCSEYTNARTCNGNGVVDATGACDCTYKVKGGDDNCKDATEARLAAQEKTDYYIFHGLSAVLVVIIEFWGIAYLLHLRCHRGQKLHCKHARLLLEFGVRSFDMFSDWAFYAISLRPAADGGLFATTYGGDAEAVRSASLAFCVTGLLLWAPDLWAFCVRTSPDGHARRSTTRRVTVLVVCAEDIPQLCLSSLYLDHLGFDLDPVATTSFAFSLVSLLMSLERIWRESGGTWRAVGRGLRRRLGLARGVCASCCARCFRGRRRRAVDLAAPAALGDGQLAAERERTSTVGMCNNPLRAPVPAAPMAGTVGNPAFEPTAGTVSHPAFENWDVTSKVNVSCCTLRPRTTLPQRKIPH